MHDQPGNNLVSMIHRWMRYCGALLKWGLKSCVAILGLLIKGVLIAGVILALRLLYGPIDITWAKNIPELRQALPSDVVPLVDNLSEVMFHLTFKDGLPYGHLSVHSKISLGENKGTNEWAPLDLELLIEPDWLTLVKGEGLIVRSLTCIIPTLDISALHVTDDPKARHFTDIHTLWPSVMATLRKMVGFLQGPELASLHSPQLELSIPSVIVRHKTKQHTQIALNNVHIFWDISQSPTSGPGTPDTVGANEGPITLGLHVQDALRIEGITASHGGPWSIAPFTLQATLYPLSPAGPLVSFKTDNLAAEDIPLSFTLDASLRSASAKKTSPPNSYSAPGSQDQLVDITATAQVHPTLKPRITVGELLKLWPKEVASSGRAWVAHHITAGKVVGLTSTLKLTLDQQLDIDLHDLHTTFGLKDLTLHYFGKLPPITQLNAHVVGNENSLTFTISQGFIKDLTLVPNLQQSASNVVIKALDTPDPHIQIHAYLAGPLATLLRVLDAQPLEYMQRVKLDPATTSGDVEAQLDIAFPLIKDILLRDVDLKAKGRIQHSHLKKLPHVSYALNNLDATFTVTTKVLTIAGAGRLLPTAQTTTAPVPGYVTLKLVNYFDHLSKIDTVINVNGTGPLSLSESSGVDLSDWVQTSPPVPFGLTYTDYARSLKKPSTLSLTIDATPVKITLPWIFYTKPSGDKAQWTSLLTFPQSGPMSLPKFTLIAGKDQFNGAALFGKKGSLKEITLRNTRFGANVWPLLQVRRHGPQSWGVTLTAREMDLTPYWRTYVMDAPPSAAVKMPAASPEALQMVHKSLTGHNAPQRSLNLDLVASVDKAYLFDSTNFFDQTTLKLKMIDDRLMNLKFIAYYAGDVYDDGRVDMSYTAYPFKKGGTATIQAKDAGALLSLLRIIERADGGTLNLNLTRDDTGLWTGQGSLQNFMITKAPLVARLLSAVSLVGVADLLNPEQGLSFASLDLEFTYFKKILTLIKTIAASPSLSITSSGTLDFSTDQLNIKGSLVPFNFVNGLVSNIPLLGDILSGGEGGGLFAFSYTGTGSLDAVNLEVNPLSILAPGFLQRLF